jgi:hypothetical protein
MPPNIDRRQLLFATVFSVLPLSASADDGETYRNLEYGFAVELPRDWHVIIPDPPRPQHGVSLVKDDRRIWIDGSYDALMLGSAVAALKDTLDQEAPGVPAETGATRLDDLHAMTAKFTRGEKSYSRIVGFRPRGDEVGIIYSLGLDTDEKNWARDDETFTTIARRFVLLPLQPSPSEVR